MNGFLPFCPSPSNCSDIYRKISDLPVDTARNTAFHTGNYVYENSVVNVDAAGDVTNSMEYHALSPSTDSAVVFIPTSTNYSYANNGAYDSESVDTLFPWKPGAGLSVEGGGNFDTCGVQARDVHPQVVDLDNGYEYEGYVGATGQGGICGGKFLEYNTSVWNLNLPIEGQYPGGQTSADAGGLPVFGLTVRYEDIAAGVIKHALRVTFPHMAAAFYAGDTYALVTSPARHSAGMGGGIFQTYMGMRLRLKASKNITGCGPQAQVVLQAMKDYGEIIADIGNAGEVQGVYDSRMDAAQFACVASNFHVSDFEVVTPQPLRAVDLRLETATGGASVYYDETGLTATSGSGPQGTLIKNDPPAPVITAFAASSNVVGIGGSVTLSATATNAVNLIVKNGGPMVSGSLVVTPTQTTTYLLTAYNGNGYDVSGRSDGTPSVTVTVTGPQVETPICTPASNAFTSAQTYSCTDATAGVGMFYTTDTTEPTIYSTPYTAPVPVATAQTFKMAAFKTGMVPSATVTNVFTFNILGGLPNIVGIVSSNADLSAYFATGDSRNNGTNTSIIRITGTFSAANQGMLITQYKGPDATVPASVFCGRLPGRLIENLNNGMQTIEVGNEIHLAGWFFPTMAAGPHTCTIIFPSRVIPTGYFYTYLAEIHGASGFESVASAFTAGYKTAPLFGCGTVNTTGPNRLVVGIAEANGDGPQPIAPTKTFFDPGSDAKGVSLEVPAASAINLSFKSGSYYPNECFSFALKP